MKNWKNNRPEGWENPYPVEAMTYPEHQARKIFEAGADAMLEAIWKMAKESPTGTFAFDTHTINIFEAKE